MFEIYDPSSISPYKAPLAVLLSVLGTPCAITWAQTLLLWACAWCILNIKTACCNAPKSRKVEHATLFLAPQAEEEMCDVLPLVLLSSHACDSHDILGGKIRAGKGFAACISASRTEVDEMLEMPYC